MSIKSPSIAFAYLGGDIEEKQEFPRKRSYITIRISIAPKINSLLLKQLRLFVRKRIIEQKRQENGPSMLKDISEHILNTGYKEEVAFLKKQKNSGNGL